jgi:hypothetical protein
MIDFFVALLLCFTLGKVEAFQDRISSVVECTYSIFPMWMCKATEPKKNHTLYEKTIATIYKSFWHGSKYILFLGVFTIGVLDLPVLTKLIILFCIRIDFDTHYTYLFNLFSLFHFYPLKRQDD